MLLSYDRFFKKNLKDKRWLALTLRCEKYSIYKQNKYLAAAHVNNNLTSRYLYKGLKISTF